MTTWLLDHNIPNQIYGFLKSKGIQNDTTQFRGWDLLKNGDLVKVAFEAEFRVLLTRDRLLRESAAKSLKLFPEMSIVLITIKQAKGQIYLSQFKEHWQKDPIKPIAGKLVIWPSE